ncbi:hypothetical protein [Paenibacillus koleovorans]|uniref:hypothetical protein n=1 Tax=Paenibacillus koleovorans TaxID=121608 RepID=UPI000FD6EC44|nr:hypothetical protein [Paenibacillus koleovorans]
MRGKSEYIIVVIPMSEIKKIVWVDVIASTALYYAIQLPVHSFLIASAGSMAGPLLIRWSLRQRGKQRVRRL